MNSISANVKAIRDNITTVLSGEKRTVLLVAATKMNDTARVREAIAAGVDACGENKVQEFLLKDSQGAYIGCQKHFIGHLQTNKINKIVGHVDLIQSVDNEELLHLINHRAEDLGICQDVLIEISIAGESQKYGIPPKDLPSLLEHASWCHSVKVRGLMCIPPLVENAGSNRPYFDAMHKLFVDNDTKKYDNVFMDFLSMGMTDDYQDAIAAGANMIRVGSAIFGRRQYF